MVLRVQMHFKKNSFFCWLLQHVAWSGALDYLGEYGPHKFDDSDAIEGGYGFAYWEFISESINASNATCKLYHIPFNQCLD